MNINEWINEYFIANKIYKMISEFRFSLISCVKQKPPFDGHKDLWSQYVCAILVESPVYRKFCHLYGYEYTMMKIKFSPLLPTTFSKFIWFS